MNESASAGNPAGLMDRIYARQRHIYDATRKFYLLGRDELIAGLMPPVGASVLEIGCGTGRNLIKIARRYPHVTCYGLDLSSAMLVTARLSVARAGLASRIVLAEADATSFDPHELFGVATFDRVVVSYALSMIPAWRAVLQRGATVLAPGGAVHLVDFGDQSRMPSLFKCTLEAWLARFHVALRPTLARDVDAVAARLGLVAQVQPLFRTYALRAILALAPDQPAC